LTDNTPKNPNTPQNPTSSNDEKGKNYNVDPEQPYSDQSADTRGENPSAAPQEPHTQAQQAAGAQAPDSEWEVQTPKQENKTKVKSKGTIVHPDTKFIVQFPETGDTRKAIPLHKLESIYTNYCFYVRPVARVDDRAGPAEIDNARNWFWSALWQNKNTYTEVIMAAIMINIFALGSSLFVMNVYDRVVPNNAIETLWVLASGVLVVYTFDFILKNLRAHFLDHAGRKADIVVSARLFEQMLGMTMEARPASAGVLASHMREFETLRDFFTSMESALKNALLFETISGLETVKVQAAEGHTQRRWEELTDKSSRTSVKMRRVNAFALNFATFVQQLVSVFVVIVGVFLIKEAEISMGALIACVILSGRAMAPLAQIAGLLTRMHQSKESLRQLDEMMKKDVGDWCRGVWQNDY